MKLLQTFLLSSALAASLGAHAQVTGGVGGGAGNFVTLSSAGLGGGAVATLAGGTIYTSQETFAAMPIGPLFGGDFLAAGSLAGEPATLDFGTGVDYVSFLWGSPDTYNLLTVTSTGGSQVFTTSTLGMPGDGNQSISMYVQFQALSGAKITGLSFTNLPGTNAFETANFSVTPVPEPQTYALMLAGLGAMGFLMRRRSPR